MKNLKIATQLINETGDLNKKRIGRGKRNNA